MLRAVEFGESDRILHLLTPRTGRLVAIAKGARRSVKRFGGNLDLCNHLRIQVERRRRMSMPHLEQAILVDAHLPLRERPARFALGCYVVEMVDRMAPESGVGADLQRLFDFLRDTLRLVSRSEPDERLRLVLELRALDALGLRPSLRDCVGCGRDATAVRPATLAAARVAFRVPDGGVVCRHCAPRAEGVLPVHIGTLRTLERALHLPLDAVGRLGIPAATLVEARELVSRFQRFHTGLQLRSEGVVDALLRRSSNPDLPPSAASRCSGPAA